ncbi:pyruvate dehydrogenase (acetyl-transferring), homodimeric type [Buchnera aphidicola (Thelaxes californica)]|uniref:Pyruvate dehydrogenase E1 component n=1 Tax=Buchnera aphidicola (Thelaxes californica) TaxID=1315998 RepID=A0A4D6YBE4_9GAMM|nr:pyruvate dehydrogenase (acetyl-transferring), homodimeric type [Buchnera aphidicola]QCI26709.1 pyruvate dehydrogenase (acetyl-transferring), homodimeric type [Buchnera aphidicola (Thelaxes californica)]
MKNDKIIKDIDVIETQEWIDSINSVICKEGVERAKFLLLKIIDVSKKSGILLNHVDFMNDYINTISPEEECVYPGNIQLEERICSAIRWNALIVVLKASKKNLDLGGHLASFQSSAVIYEVCFNHFFKSYNQKNGGDLIYFQGHISPGIYARAFLEGRLTEHQMNNFRQEVDGNGLSSYPHPKLMPDFWQFPTVSMGLGAICSIYQAKFLKYLENRGLKNTASQTVYTFLGDGEMEEPESKGAISVAAKNNLDNLIFIINCNLQSLDGPVSGNRKIINELENIFVGSGWYVIKVIWSSEWDQLLRKDLSGKLIHLINETVDGDYQNFSSKDISYFRKNFFGKYKETAKLVENLTDLELENLKKGGHDFRKVFSALNKAQKIKNQPTVILMHTTKGYGMGKVAEGRNAAHQVKKIDIDTLKIIKNKLNIPIKNSDLSNLPYFKFSTDSKEYQYIVQQRKKLGGYVPQRIINFTHSLTLPTLVDFQSLLLEQKKSISTTIGFVRILNILLRNKYIKDRIVPIIADEARTFGMEGLFRKIGIYNPDGQKYTAQDSQEIIFYKEDHKGQILQEGISELGAAASWLAAATSYSNNNFPMIPFYIYYSIFGFQRIGDLLWAAGDQQARGFLIGATSGRTTLNGEGLQHEDGHSHIQSLTIPNCISYNPAYLYELVTIIENGIHRMYGLNQENIYFYITTMNENYVMPAMPEGANEGILKGIYKLKTHHGKFNYRVQLLGSGSILQNVCEAGLILEKLYGIGSDIYSVTSFTELAREGQDCDRWNLLHPNQPLKIPYISKVVETFPTVAVSDYMKLYADQVRKYIPHNYYHVLGTDGFGKSDSRENLRNYFEVNAQYIVLSALSGLSHCNFIKHKIVLDAMQKFNINSEKINPRIF